MKTLAIILLATLCLIFTLTSHSTEPSPQNIPIDIKNHVDFLSSDLLQGRLTGSPGEKIATQYVANIFYHLGLIPAGDNGTYFQTFHFTAGVSLGGKNTCSLTTSKGKIKHLILGQTWQPLSFSDSTIFHVTDLVFAGYGVTAPAQDKLPAYNSYHNLNVKNKWVVVFRYLPGKMTPERNRQLTPYASLRYKAFTAKEHGAKGIIFVSGSNIKVMHELIPIAFDTSIGSGIAAISVTDNIINDLLSPLHTSLQTLQNCLDKGKPSPITNIMPVQMTGVIDITKKIQTGRNVLGKLEAGGNSMIVIGAHIDHLGYGELGGSLANKNEQSLIHNGADDNASGVAGMLEIARYLTEKKTSGKLIGKKDILFAAWSGEELGLLGSSHFVKTALQKTQQTSLHSEMEVNLNLDMIGHLRSKLVLQGTASSMSWPKLLEQLPANQQVVLITQTDPYLPTDSTSFYLHGVPILNFFTGAHESYHTPRDKAASINYSGIKIIADTVTDIILRLEKNPHAIDFSEVKKTTRETGGIQRVYLGTIPDYTSAERVGVKLSGIKKDSPAERADLRADDLIVELAGKEVHDIYDYSFVLNTLPIGKPVTIVVLRNHRKMPLTIVAETKE